MTRLRILFSLLLLVLLTLPVAAQDTGSANFASYVAIGDSLTQGFSNGGVFAGVQVNSYPALIARQAGVTDFEQPLVSAPGIPGLLQLQSLAPVIVPRQGNGAPTNLTLPRPYNNLGVSGFDTADVLTTLTGNPIIDLTLRGLGPVIGQALALQPTFVTVWLGNNDALGAATSGLVIDGVTLTTLAQFEADYRTVIGALAQTGAGIVVATVPNVTAIPFVNTIPPVLVDPATRQPVSIGGQLVPLIGPDGPLNPATDKVLLTASPLLAQGIGIPAAAGGTNLPLPDEVVLNGNEIATITDRVIGFNNVIRQVAGEVGATVFDANAFLDDVVANGFAIGGITYTTDFLTGGIFSYDGVHPTPFGYAVIANRMIDAINAGFGAALEPVNLLPFVFGPDGLAGAFVLDPRELGDVVFSEQAASQLWDSIGVPAEVRLFQPDEDQESEEEEEPLKARRLSGGG